MKRILCLLLAGIMLLGATACGTGDAGTDPNEDAGTRAEDEGADPNYTCDLPELDYGNTPIKIIYAKATGREDEIKESGDGGVVSDAVHERNVAVEEQLKVKLEFYDDGTGNNVATLVDRDIKSGLGDYDIVTNGTYLSVSPAVQGSYLDLSKLDYIDTSKHYWTQGYNDMVTFTEDEMQFLATGPIAISLFRYTYFTIYNKKQFEASKIPDLYDTVMAKEWTLDYQYSISTNHYLDSDGDGKASRGDTYGFVTGDTISTDAYPVAGNVHLIVKEPDTHALTFNSDALVALSDLVDKVQLLYNDASTYVFKGSTEDDVPLNNIIEMFADGRSLMATVQFLKLESNFNELAAMSYGIAPIPKLLADQEYHSYVQDQVTSFGISAVVGDEKRQEMCAAVLEAMAYHSNLLVRPAYYDSALSLRYMQDPQSQTILNLIFESLYFDFSSSCCNMLSTHTRDRLRPIFSGSSSGMSTIKAWKTPINNSLRRINDRLYKLQTKK
jgi:hypothetical protein